eukprot:TRINITY_DN4453_c0_g1_i1.p1 TRINITY_DN4453_c0_g1~~TRINITY_DN4453_c0_g1_i1.p1  ORF type:complete len:216 (+),score=34.25 TRINITY_DN4453_c0_g1_i1:50-649(+)
MRNAAGILLGDIRCVDEIQPVVPAIVPRKRATSAPPIICKAKMKPEGMRVDPGAIIDAMRGNAAFVTRHKNGFRLLQIVVDHGTTNHVTELIDELKPVLVRIVFKSTSQPFLFRLINAIRTPYQVRQFTHPFKTMLFDMLASRVALPVLRLCVLRLIVREITFIIEGAANSVCLLVRSKKKKEKDGETCRQHPCCLKLD